MLHIDFVFIYRFFVDMEQTHAGEPIVGVLGDYAACFESPIVQKLDIIG